MGSLSEVIAAARDGIGRHGTHAAALMDDRSEGCRATGDVPGRAFWAHVAWAVRVIETGGLLRPVCGADH